MSSQVARFLSATDRHLPLVFAACAIPLLLILLFVTPPFQSPDEDDHFLRAYEISQGKMVSDKQGSTNEAIARLVDLYQPLNHHAEIKTSGEIEKKAKAIEWQETQTKADFVNTAAYPPFDYLPQALAIRCALALDFSPYQTLYAVRFLNALTSLLLSACAIGFCKRGRYVMTAVLLLPMPLSLFASCNQDASLLPLTALLAAFYSRLLAEKMPLSGKQGLLLGCLLFYISIARPPYLLLMAPVVFIETMPRWKTRRTGFFLLLLTILFLAGWMFSGSFSHAASNVEGVDAMHQIAYLKEHVWAVPRLVLTTLRTHAFNYASGFVGILGWLDTPFPHAYYSAAFFALFASVFAERWKAILNRRFQLWMVLAIAASVSALFFAEYLIGTPPAYPTIESVQGRYFIPFVLLLAAAIPAFQIHDKIIACARLAALAFPLLTMIYTPLVLVERYYLSADKTEAVTAAGSFSGYAMPLRDGLSARQKFRAMAPSFSAMDLAFVTFSDRHIDYPVIWSIKDAASGDTVRSGVIRTASLHDWKPKTIEINPPLEGKGWTYEIAIEVQKSVPDDKTAGLPFYALKSGLEDTFSVETNDPASPRKQKYALKIEIF